MTEKSMMKQAYGIYKQGGETGLREWAMSLPDDDLQKFLQEWLELRNQLYSLTKDYLTSIIEDNEQEDK
jgi:hypothetical protein